jgi:hypothetical protein
MNSNTPNLDLLPSFRPQQPLPTAPTPSVVTTKASCAVSQRATPETAKPAADDDCAAEVFLLEERSDGDDTSVIYLAHVREPERLLSRRGMHFHGDVIEALSDLLLTFVAGKPSNDTDANGR